MRIDDAELVRRARAGNLAAIRALMERLRVPLVKFAAAFEEVGLPRRVLLDAVAGATRDAMFTFDTGDGERFADHVLRRLRPILEDLLAVGARAPIN